ncbi:MAG: rhodanese-like domain-containing protein [Gammaproteobacteria bacterium]|nr:rhodanese-like domain-containing protein [Gammaproteobacteria bacterium]
MNKIFNSVFIFYLRYLFIILVSCGLFSTVVQAEKFLAPEQIEGVIRVTAEEVFDLVVNEPALIIIDSRKQEQFNKGHIQDALNILDSKMTESQLTKFVTSKLTPVVFYCNGDKCLRSANASAKAHEWGYHRVYWFRGGWKEWVAKKMPVSRVIK